MTDSANQPVQLLPQYHIDSTIGAIISEWNKIEMHMVFLVSALLKVKMDVAQLIMGSTNMRPKKEILNAAFREKISDSRLISVLDDINNEFNNAWDYRNYIVHGIQFSNLETGEVGFYRKPTAQNSRSATELTSYLAKTILISIRMRSLFVLSSICLSENHTEAVRETLLENCLAKLHRDLGGPAPPPPTEEGAPPSASPQ